MRHFLGTCQRGVDALTADFAAYPMIVVNLGRL
jgi:hypothetical protein